MTHDNVARAILRLVRDYGIDTVFGIPGTHNLEFYRHFNDLGFRAVTARHEQGAGYAADGWAQRTGLPGVVVTTSGPGLLNVLSAAGTAYCESRPLLILSPGVPRGSEFADVGALHETKDQVTAAGAIVEWACRASSGDEAIEAVHKAFHIFRTARPRPVYLEVPLDLLESPADIDPDRLVARAVSEPARAADTEVRKAAQALAGAENPAILAGGGSIPAAAALRDIAELLAAPVVTSMNGKGVLPESHPLAIGSELRLEAGRAVLNEADTLLVVGSKIGEAELWGGSVAPRGAVIRVDISASQANKNLPANVVLTGDSRAVLPQLLDALRSAGLTQREPDVTTLDARRAACASESREVARTEDTCAGLIAAALPADAIITGDSSQISYYGMASRVRSEQPHAFLYMAAYATLGYGLPAAIGARIGSPESPVVGVIGDGALMFSIQEFQTAVEQRLDLTIICVDNGGYGEIRHNEIDRGIAPIGVDLTQPNWPALADAFGGHGFAVNRADELKDVLQRAIATAGVSLVHVPLNLFEDLT